MESIVKKFSHIGARVKILKRGDPGTLRRRITNDIGINILNDSEGEYFDIILENPDNIELQVLDTQKDDKHLLLMAKIRNEKKKFLCGYDERHFFSCAIPETASVSTVLQAKQALKPENLVDTEIKGGIKTKNLHKRHRKIKQGTIHRQGEFFFIPLPNFKPPSGSLTIIHKNEPMSRGGKPHMAQYLYREGGTKVYVCRQHPNGMVEKNYQEFLKTNKEAKEYRWNTRVRDPDVYVKGKINHDDHKTLNLGDVWHQVVLNTEDKALAAENVTFLD